MLNHDSQLYAHHLDEQRRYEVDKPVAEVTQHPQNPQIWGLRNLSAQKWTSQNADGDVNHVEPGKTVTLSSGLRIQFGSREGEVRL